MARGRDWGGSYLASESSAFSLWITRPNIIGPGVSGGGACRRAISAFTRSRMWYSCSRLRLASGIPLTAASTLHSVSVLTPWYADRRGRAGRRSTSHRRQAPGRHHDRQHACIAHTPCSVSSRHRRALGHISGTSHRDLLAIVEIHRDLSSRSSGILTISAEVRSAPAQDPAYRPTHPFHVALTEREGRLDGHPSYGSDASPVSIITRNSR